jgi:hypothetical protein
MSEWVTERERERQQSHSPVEGMWISSSQTPPLVEEEASFQNMLKSGKNKNMVMDPSGARNQEWLCWQWTAAIYWTAEL